MDTHNHIEEKDNQLHYQSVESKLLVVICKNDRVKYHKSKWIVLGDAADSVTLANNYRTRMCNHGSARIDKKNIRSPCSSQKDFRLVTSSPSRFHCNHARTNQMRWQSAHIFLERYDDWFETHMVDDRLLGGSLIYSDVMKTLYQMLSQKCLTYFCIWLRQTIEPYS